MGISRKMILWILGGLTGAVLVVLYLGGQVFTLRYKVPVGDLTKYRVSYLMQGDYAFPGIPSHPVDSHLYAWMTERATKVEDDGNTTLLLQAQGATEVLAGHTYSMVDPSPPLIVVVTPLGEIKEIQGGEEPAGLSELAMILPTQPVRVGSTWTGTRSVMLPGSNQHPVQLQVNYTFERMDQVQNRQCAVITASLSNTNLPIPGGPKKAALIAVVKGSGKVAVDVSTGQTLQSDYVLIFNLKDETPAQYLHLTITSSTSLI